MLAPKKVKYRKMHRTPYDGKAKGNKYVAFGEYGLVSTTGNWVKGNQIEAARIVLAKVLGKTGKMWTRIFPQLSITKKPLEVRMGSGKGNPEYYVAVVKEGTVMFEIAGVEEKIAREALRKAGNKLAVLCRVVSKGDLAYEATK
ncbi:MAG: 50S ribosomal protein L16 [Mycoplasmoidaceae bacterium]|nr:MAG: 50S ribosomal protein L16 [Mycoplasmoidaceae bacterium]